MMQCQVCGDTQGPFEIEDIKSRCMLVCETCGKQARKEQKYGITQQTKLQKIFKRNSKRKGEKK